MICSKKERDTQVPQKTSAYSKNFTFKYLKLLYAFFFSELCWGKAMVAYPMPQQRKKEESKRLRADRDQIEFIDLGFERWQVVRFRKARGRQAFHKLHILGMNGDLWDRVRGLGSETWKGCE